MKISLILLIIVAVLIVLFPLVSLVQYNLGNQVMVDGFTVSGSTVLLLSIVFSTFSWFLFAWASKSIKVVGIPLSIISGAVLMSSFYDVLGPMAAVIVGIVAGFVAFLLQKKMINPIQNKPLIIAAIIISLSYFVLIMMVLTAQATTNGIGEWSGTADGIEEKGFDNIFNNGIDFNSFLFVIPSLILTGLIIQGKTIKSKFLIIIGTALIIQGFLVTLFLVFILFSPTFPPTMNPIEGFIFIFMELNHAFLSGTIMGILVTIIGVISFRKERIRDNEN